jgi:hypothetical protein
VKRFFLRTTVILGLFFAFVLFPLYLAGAQDDTTDITDVATHPIPAIFQTATTSAGLTQNPVDQIPRCAGSGPKISAKQDVVVRGDFIYGESQPVH